MNVLNKKVRLNKRAEWLSAQTFVLLSIQVPKDNDKTPQSAEQFFAALHGIYRNDPNIQEFVSLEIVAAKDTITFFVFTPIHLREFIESQLYAQYPDLQIDQVPDYTRDIQLEGKHVICTDMKLNKEGVYPLKTFASMDVDPLAGITAVLSGLAEGEHIWIQIVVQPIGDEWQQKGVDYVNSIRMGKKTMRLGGNGVVSKAARMVGRVVKEVIEPGSGAGEVFSVAGEPPKLSAPQEAALKGIESKITKLGFESVIRLVAIAPDVNVARSKIQAVLAAYKQFNTTNLNGFVGGEIKVDDYAAWEKYITREVEAGVSILNIEELASVYHFPSSGKVETSALSWAGSKKGEAPFNLPLKGQIPDEMLTIIGNTDYRNIQKEFGIKIEDRKRHMYVIGKSGVGKSTLLENMAIDDVLEGRGVIIVDPHGETAERVLDCVPENRIQDVILFDPSDREHPVAFNLLEKVGDDYKGMVASGFVAIFKKIFGNSWGPRLEYILRNTVLALLDTDNATMLGIPRMLTDQSYRNEVVSHVQDAVIRDFWVNEFAAMDPKQRSEAVAPILNKVGQFLSTSTIRNIVGQPKSTFDIRRIMDEKKILLVNLSKGKIGEDNMALLGAMMITKVQLAAMSRANVPYSQRPECFLYVDEFQNFATESFATILSEARKYNLGLTIAHQYMAQLSDEVKDAVIGNVGTMIAFRIGAPDAAVLVKEFAPNFDENDLINLEIGRIYIKLLIDGISAPAFSAQTINRKPIESSFRDRIIDYSRQHYTRNREEVETTIDETAGYKKKREAEEARGQAAKILNSGEAQRLAIKQNPDLDEVTKPVVIPEKVPLQNSGEKNNEQERVENKVDVASSLEDENHTNTESTVNKPEELVVKDNKIAQNNTHLEAGKGSVSNENNHLTKPEKPLRAMKGWVYKEVSQKGGMKWFLGEKEDVYKKRIKDREEKKEEKMPEIKSDIKDEVKPDIKPDIKPDSKEKKQTLTKEENAPVVVADVEVVEKIEKTNSPVAVSPTEQLPNIANDDVELIVPENIEDELPAVVMKKDEDLIVLEEGKSVKLD